MDSRNLSCSNCSNLSENVNDSSQATNDTAKIYIPSLFIFVALMFGFVGNLFVIAVYIRRMTTSTKVYLFSLATADATVCMGGMVLTRVAINETMKYIVGCCMDISVVFSMYTLAFVSTERLVAVWRPHSFTLSPKRAKVVLSVIAAFGVSCSVVMAISRKYRRTYPHYEELGRFYAMSVTLISVLVIVVCYTLVAGKMLVNFSASRKKVGVQM